MLHLGHKVHVGSAIGRFTSYSSLVLTFPLYLVGFMHGWLTAFQAGMPSCHGHLLASSCWALATLGITPGVNWRSRLATALEQNLDSLTDRHISMAVWALGEWKSGSEMSPTLVSKLGNRVGWSINGLNPNRLKSVFRRHLPWSMMKIKGKNKKAVWGQKQEH
jgi:hypothetical protein